MPLLPADQLKDVVRATLRANLTGDQAGVLDAMRPVFDTGDAGDGYLMAAAFIGISIADLPKTMCPEHGRDCVTVGVGIVPVDDDGHIDWETAGPAPSIPPEMERDHPAMVAYLRMVAAEAADDVDMALALWCAAVQHGHAPEVLWRALQAASDTLRLAQAREGQR